MGLLAQPLIWLVRAYQVVLSPVMGGACRFEPSCSNYMIEALKVHGAFKGTLIGLWRILRCHPFGAHGYDPVPPKGRWRVEGLGMGDIRQSATDSRSDSSTDD